MGEIFARMQQKTDNSTNWQNASLFVPKNGEVIVYSKEDGTPTRIKIGDGSSTLEELEFITGEVYTSKQEPVGAREGAIWILDDDLTSEKQKSVFIDWNETEDGEDKYIKNRPIWIQEENDVDGLKKISNTTAKLDTIYQICGINCYNVSDFYVENIADLEQIYQDFYIYFTENSYSKITGVCFSTEQWVGEEIEDGIYFVNGSVYGYPSNTYLIGEVYRTTNEQDGIITVNRKLLACFFGITYLDGAPPAGTYFFIGEDNGFLIESLRFPYRKIEVKEEYSPCFKKVDEVRIYSIDEFTLANLVENAGEDGNLVSALITELSRFQIGDIVLIPSTVLEALKGAG